MAATSDIATTLSSFNNTKLYIHSQRDEFFRRGVNVRSTVVTDDTKSEDGRTTRVSDPTMNDVNPLDLTAADCMTKPVVTVMPDMSPEECCRIMEEKLIRRVPVVDERGSCLGIIALADIALHTGKKVAGHIVREVSEPTLSASAVAV